LESSEVARLPKPEGFEAQTRRILLVASPGTQILDVVGPFQIFERAKELFAAEHAGSPPIYSTEVVSTSSETGLVTSCGLRIEAHRNFRRVRGEIDTLLIAGGGAIECDQTGNDVVQWTRDVARRVRRIGSVCTGAMLLARAGLLDGRKATTHWKWCEQLAKKYPRVQVDPNPIFVRDGNIYTSAGVTAGMDLALALVEEDHGSRLALAVARELVLYLRRAGGQSQFSSVLSLQFTDRAPLRELGAWVLDNLNKPLNVALLAEQVAMSPRHFARTFTQEMRITPAKFVERTRIETARRRLEESQSSLEQIAEECGFTSVNAMRAVFQRALEVSPGQYRQHFRSMREPGPKQRSGARKS
jgi:transcriptional regulator GlxA family with amidase domain